MPDQDRSPVALRDDMPSALDRVGAVSQGDRHRISNQWLRDLALQAARAETRVVSGHAAIADGGAGSTTILFRANIAAGEELVDGVYARNAAIVDEVPIGAGQTIASFDLAGVPAVVMSGDNLDLSFALVSVLVAGVPTHYAIFGAEAATGTSVGPTAAQIKTSLEAAAISEPIADLDASVHLVLARGTYARGVGTVALTGVDPDTDDALRAEQVIGSLGL